jgi:Excalibur calcium-binding domain.
MTSYKEAQFFLENCPEPKMDGDNDGIPCERQFKKWLIVLI